MYKAKRFGGWSALVTNDFFLKDENLSLAREAGCKALFSGVESFDAAWLQSVNKSQNTRLPQVDLIRKCLDAGIVFLYGLMLDPATRRIADMRREIDFITHTPEITLPSYLSVPIPMLGTPFFKESLAQRRLLPNTKLRDLDSTTLCLQTLDPLEDVAEFVRDLQTLRGHHAAVLSHSARWLMRYGSRFSFTQKLIALSSPAILCAPALATAPGWMKFGRRSAAKRRTHVSTTEPLDALYTPAFPVAARYENYFEPTMLTDASGALAPEVAELELRTPPRKSSTLAPVASVA
jgi:hypothetical protein